MPSRQRWRLQEGHCISEPPPRAKQTAKVVLSDLHAHTWLWKRSQPTEKNYKVPSSELDMLLERAHALSHTWCGFPLFVFFRF